MSTETQCAHPTPCVVCGKSYCGRQLSTLGRCWDCIMAASAAWERKVAEARAAERAAEPPGWREFWENYPKPDHRLDSWLFAMENARREFAARQRVRRPRPVASSRRDVRARLVGLVDFVLTSSPGERNARLFWATCKAGELVAARLVDEQAVVDIMSSAAADVGLTSHEIGDATRGTIGSALRNARSAA